MSIAIPSFPAWPNWWRSPLILPPRRRIDLSPRESLLNFANPFRWMGADRSKNTCKTCGCTTSSPPGNCTTCCTNNGGPTSWDVDLSAFNPSNAGGCFTVNGFKGCSAIECSVLSGVVSLSQTTTCSWQYLKTICSTWFIRVTLVASSSGSNCIWFLTINDNACSGAAQYKATVAKGACSGMTLSLFSGSTPPPLICAFGTMPSTLGLTPG